MTAMAYIATAPCGCTYMAHADNPDDQRASADAVSRAIKEGGHVERVPAEEARGRLVMDCPHDPKWGGKWPLMGP